MLRTFYVSSLYSLWQTSITADGVVDAVVGCLPSSVLAPLPNWILICSAGSPAPAPQGPPDYLRSKQVPTVFLATITWQKRAHDYGPDRLSVRTQMPWLGKWILSRSHSPAGWEQIAHNGGHLGLREPPWTRHPRWAQLSRGAWRTRSLISSLSCRTCSSCRWVSLWCETNHFLNFQFRVKWNHSCTWKSPDWSRTIIILILLMNKLKFKGLINLPKII